MTAELPRREPVERQDPDRRPRWAAELPNDDEPDQPDPFDQAWILWATNELDKKDSQ